LVTYLKELKTDLSARPCNDFRGYVAAIAHTACHDYFRQRYPARTRLHKKIRDVIHAHPNLAMWKPPGETVSHWLCGFASWQGRETSVKATVWLRAFYENPDSQPRLWLRVGTFN
jgi:hypothetical protein